MSRARKLLIVGLVLTVGIGLAWPFRKTGDDNAIESVAKTPAIDFGRAESTLVRPTSQPLPMGSPAPHVVAKMTSLGDAGKTTRSHAPTASFDLANHPALAAPLSPRVASPVTPPLPPKIQPIQREKTLAQVEQTHGNSRPAYSTIERDRVFGAESQHEPEVRHVVQNSDTLEKLAKRYLGDEGRALEIFDLNRDVLDNPHLLPIDAELRIPVHFSVD